MWKWRKKLKSKNSEPECDDATFKNHDSDEEQGGATGATESEAVEEQGGQDETGDAEETIVENQN